MGKSSDELRQEIDQSRRDATSKINQLQDEVQGTAEELRTQASGAAEDVREQVNATVNDTIDSVRENVNIEEMVQQRPLVSVGAALIGGFVLGGMLGGGGGGQSRQSGYAQGTSAPDYGSGHSGGGLGESVRDAFRKSGLEDTFSNASAALISSVTDQVKDTIDRNMPGFSERMDTAKDTDGSVMDKTRRTQP